MFLGDGMTSLVLFYSTVTRLFVSLALNKKFHVFPGVLAFLLEVQIPNDPTMSTLRVHEDCVLDTFHF